MNAKKNKLHESDCALNANFIIIIIFAMSMSACYPTLPSKPPCFEDGVELEQQNAPLGSFFVKNCCLVDDDCVRRFTSFQNEGLLSITSALINRFSTCNPLSNTDANSHFSDLTMEYGTCFLNITHKNSECRNGADCEGSQSCCVSSGDICSERFNTDEFINCAICQDEPC